MSGLNVQVTSASMGVWSVLGANVTMTEATGASDQAATDGPLKRAQNVAADTAKRITANNGVLSAADATVAAANLRATVDPTKLTLADFDDRGERIDPILSAAANAFVSINGDLTLTNEKSTANVGAIVATLQGDARGNAASIDSMQVSADAIADRMRATSDPAEQAALARQWAEANDSIEKLRKAMDREQELADLERQLMFDNPSPATIDRLRKLGLGKLVDRIIESYVMAARRTHGYVPPAAAGALKEAGYGGMVSADLATHEARKDRAQADSRHWITLADGTIVPFVPSEDMNAALVAQGKTRPRVALPEGVAAPSGDLAAQAGGAAAQGVQGASLLRTR